MNILIRKKRIFFIYLLPGVLLYIFTVICPILLAAYYGLFEWSGGPQKEFIGLSNFVEVFKDAGFWKSFSNSMYLTVVCIIGHLGIGFVIAILMNSRSIRFKRFHRTAIFLPTVMSAVVVGFIWQSIYDYHNGLLNAVLRVTGAGQLAQSWLSNSDIAMQLVTIPIVWQYIGYYLVIMLSAFTSIDPEILDMAEIDGATGVKKAIYITLPLMRKTILACLTLSIAGNMKAFDHIFVMTKGGPGYATNVMALYAFNTSFRSYRMGYGSAMALVILVISLLVIGGGSGLGRLLLRDKEG